ncbi:sphingomyelin synthase-related protein 1-like [Bolinopsis microptera]|uniref:sphingomyelin synthase-related protein 1-like n=1 Tax=Bolinopsis microptera TaxID=2820187 RepID=UPI00307A314F
MMVCCGTNLESLKPDFWTKEDVGRWLEVNGFEHLSVKFDEHDISGPVLMMLTEQDLRKPPLSLQKLGEIKRLSSILEQLQRAYNVAEVRRHRRMYRTDSNDYSNDVRSGLSLIPKNEGLKFFVSFLYALSSLIVTSIAMTVAHDRVPDMKKIPPLPDIFLDNIPTIPHAFEAAEACAVSLTFSFFCLILVHKHRFVIFRRYFSIIGTVFLLRALTMMSTTLSVPGEHLNNCEIRVGDSWDEKLQHVIYIWRGAGMSISGVRTCGDYMFSGHTAVLTVLNLFVCEYTSSKLKFIQTISWSLNFFGAFFILAAHEHYTIDVIVAFYITSRTFAYYHVLANSLAHKQRNSQELTWSWFPLYSYFEENVDCKIQNEYEWPWTPIIEFVMRSYRVISHLRQERRKNSEKIIKTQ